MLEKERMHNSILFLLSSCSGYVYKRSYIGSMQLSPGFGETETFLQ